VNNLKQLQLAFQMYPTDNRDYLVKPGNSGTEPYSWVQGWLDFNPSNSDNTNQLQLLDKTKAAFAPYMPSAGAYKCPADQSSVTIKGVRYPRVRSMSMSQAIGGPGGWLMPSSYNEAQKKYKVFIKEGDLGAPGPSNVYVLLDEHPDGINAGGYANMMVESPAAARMIDFPASYHNGAAGISFADGHAEIRKWVDPRTKAPVRYNSNLALNVAQPNNPDIQWLSDRTTIAN
jgi:prepilin-type processing-associated H-X9-DG protein